MRAKHSGKDLIGFVRVGLPNASPLPTDGISGMKLNGAVVVAQSID
jgi:hypothetical protein